VAARVEPGVGKQQRSIGLMGQGSTTVRKLAVRSVGPEEVKAQWSTVAVSQRKKRSGMELYPTMWPVARA
jgi:hypothetical protein